MTARTRLRTPAAPSPTGTARDGRHACDLTAEGAAWLASAETYPPLPRPVARPAHRAPPYCPAVPPSTW